MIWLNLNDCMGSLLSEWMDAPTDAPADFPESRGRYDASYKKSFFLFFTLGIRSVIIKCLFKVPVKDKEIRIHLRCDIPPLKGYCPTNL